VRREFDPKEEANRNMIKLVEGMLWIIIIQQAASNWEIQDYTVEKYEESLGIYYQNQGQINLYITEWSVVVHVNLKKIDNHRELSST
jgi:hypothetical protein